MVDKKVYVLVGQDSLSKHYFIEEKVKKKYLTSDASSFKFFFSEDIDRKQLEEELRLVSMFPRVLVIHSAQDLGQDCQEIFKRLIKHLSSTVVVFDYGVPYEEVKSDDFFRFLSGIQDSSVHKTRTTKQEDFRDLFYALDRKNCFRALCVLDSLFFTNVSLRDFASRLVGALVMYYVRREKGIPPALVSMERKIKSGIVSREIIEFFILKLCLKA